MTIGDLARLARALAGTPRRLEKTALVADFLRGLEHDEVPWAVAFLAGRPLPASDPRVLNLSAAALRPLPADAPSGASRPLPILEAARAFAAIADAAGAGSRAAKVGVLRDLLAAAAPEERQVLLAALSGELRTGVHDGLIQEAVARAAGVPPAPATRPASPSGSPGSPACGTTSAPRTPTRWPRCGPASPSSRRRRASPRRIDRPGGRPYPVAS